MVPPDPGKGVEGGSADVAGRQEGGGRFGKWMSACWFWRAPKIMGARPQKWVRALILREHPK